MTSTPRLRRRGAIMAALATALCAMTASSAVAVARTTYTTGINQLTADLVDADSDGTPDRIDLAFVHAEVVDDEWTAAVLPGADGTVTHDLDDVVIHLPTEGNTYAIPADPVEWRAWGPAGADIFESPWPGGTPNPAPYRPTDTLLGVNARLVSRSEISTRTANRNVSFKLVGAVAPGRAMISGATGRIRTLAPGAPPAPGTSTIDPSLAGTTVRGEDAGTRVFAFNNVGVYCLDFQASAFLPDLTPVSSPTRTLRVVVGDWETWGEADCGAGPVLPDDYYDSGVHDIWDHTTNALLPLGHTDLAPRLDEDGELQAGLHQTGTGIDRWWDLANTVVYVPDTAQVVIPQPATVLDGSLWDSSFIAPVGARIWRIPAGGDRNGTPALGYSGEDFEPGDFSGRPQWRLESVTSIDGSRAPGEFFIGTDQVAAMSGGSPHFSTRQGLPQSQGFPSGAHVHAHWDFTAAGTYCVAMRFAGRATGTGAFTSTSRVLTVVVGGAEPDPTATKTCEQRHHDGEVTFPPATPAAAPVPAPPGRAVVRADDPARQSFASLVPRIVDGRLDVAFVRGSQTSGGVAYDVDDVVLATDATLDLSHIPELTAAWGAGGRQVLSTRNGTTVLGVSALDASLAMLDGPLTWSLGRVRGAGQLQFVSDDGPARLSTVPALASDTASVAPDTTVSGSWYFQQPGVYCVPMTFSGAVSGEPVRVTKTLTVAAGVRADRVQPGSECSSRTVLVDGHIDIKTTVNTDGIVQTVHDDGASPAVDREIDSVTLRVPDAVRSTLGASPAWAFLGAAGTPVWILPQTQEPGIVWPGWNLVSGTRELTASSAVTWTLGDVVGPGRFTLFTIGGFGEPSVLLGSAPGQPKAFSFGEHGHGNWAFGADGAYCVPITATEAETGFVARFTLLFAVGDLAAGSVTPADCGKSADEIEGRQVDPEPTPTPTASPTATPSVIPQPEPSVAPKEEPKGDPVPRAPRAATIAPRGMAQTVGGGKRLATLARLSCPAGGPKCGVSAPARVTVKIAGKRYRLAVLAPKSIKAGARATLRVRLSKAAATRLKGRRATVRVKVTIAAGTTRTSRTVAVTIRASKPRRATS